MGYLRGEEPNANYRYVNLKSEIIGYWGSEREEIAFPIYNKLLVRMKEASVTKTVGVRVENISQKNLVNATWVIINENSLPSDSNDPNIFYAVLDDALIKELTRRADYGVINARIGKRSNGTFYVYFNKSVIRPHEGGVGSVVDGSGAVVR